MEEFKIIKETPKRHKCRHCNKDATKHLNFREVGQRHEPGAWSYDYHAFSCDEHEREIKREVTDGGQFVWSGTYEYGKQFEHKFIYQEREDVTALVKEFFKDAA